MKEALITLLYKEYKQSLILKDLEKLGIEVHSLSLYLYDIVFDLVGIPKDNTLEYNVNGHIPGEHNNPLLKEMDSDFYSRDYLQDEWISLINTHTNTVVVDYKGIQLKQEDKADIVDKINTFIDWLYLEKSLVKSQQH